MRRQIILLAILCLSGPAAAQDVDVDSAVVHACFDSVPRGRIDADCIGIAARACQQGGNDTTIGIGFCLKSEFKEWDAILNREYAATRDNFAHLPKVQETLKTAQRAWIELRDADCTVAYDRYDGGSMRTVASGFCMLDHTARRALDLRNMRDN